MKKIKFNLQINGKTCFNIEQLRDNFNINDVVELFDKGVLKRWLSIHNLKELEDKVSSIDINTSLDNKVRELTLIFFKDTNKAEEIIKKYFEELELKKQQEVRQAAAEKQRQEAQARRQATKDAIQAEKDYWNSLIKK